MTKLLYLKDQTLTSSQAVVTSIEQNNNLTCLQFDQTIFYPQGGGQACDVGTISSAQGLFTVTSVKKINDSVIHFGMFVRGSFAPGDSVVMHIDAARRLRNSRLQSAGHLIDACLVDLGITSLIANKGYHFPDGPYNEYLGTLPNESDIRLRIETKANELIGSSLPITITFAEDGITRFVAIAGFPKIPCGGTHVATLAELKTLRIRKVSSKKKITRIAYSLE